MKKIYEKPGMYVENFSLSQSIAAGCNALHDSTLGNPTHWSKTTCGWNLGNVVVWPDTEICKAGDGQITVPWSPDAPFEGVCYNNPTANAAIFNS